MGGQKYFQIIKDMLNKAQSSIHFQVYLFNDDDTGRV